METDFFECDCYSDEHTLRFWYDPEDNIIHTSVFLNQYRRFYKRIWVALKYIFGYKCKYGHWDCFIMRKEDLPRFKTLIEKAEKNVE